MVFPNTNKKRTGFKIRMRTQGILLNFQVFASVEHHINKTQKVRKEEMDEWFKIGLVWFG